MNNPKELFSVAQNYYVGGATASGRFHPVLGRPLYIEKADGCRLYTIDGKEYIDYHSSSGASLMGYNHPAIKRGIQKALDMGFFCNFETEYHAELGKLICEMVPSAEKVRLQNTGTEATMAACRLARYKTGKRKILKFEGHFHGMHDYTFFNWHSHLAEFNADGTLKPIPDSGGIPKGMEEFLVIIPWNDYELFEKTVEKYRDDLAAVIMEPICYNAGCIPADKEYMQKVRDLTAQEGIILIYDEVLSGFRMAPGGAQEYYGVTPDISALAKAVGCGMPISAVVGRSDIMDGLTPKGKTVVSGTYTGHLITVMGAIEALKELKKPETYVTINKNADYFYSSMNQLFKEHDIPSVVQGIGARFGIFWGHTELPITDFRVAAQKYKKSMTTSFVTKALDKGIYVHDYGDSIVPMHSGFTTVHTKSDFDETLNRIDDILTEMKKEA